MVEEELWGSIPTLRPLPKDYQSLCPDFVRRDVEEEAWDFQIREIMQATFYAMVVSDALELGKVTKNMTLISKDALMTVNWYSFEAWLRIHRQYLLAAWHPIIVASAAASPAVALTSSPGSNESVGSDDASIASSDGVGH